MATGALEGPPGTPAAVRGRVPPFPFFFYWGEGELSGGREGWQKHYNALKIYIDEY